MAGSRSAPPAAPSAAQLDGARLFLLFGNDEVSLNDARFGLVSRRLTPEERDSNLCELRPAGTQPLTLDRALDTIIGELGTGSFLPGSPRMLVVYNLREFFGEKESSRGKSAKKKEPAVDRAQVLADFLTQVLPTTDNIAVFVCDEDEDKRRHVDESGVLFQTIARHGVVWVHRERPLQYELEACLYRGQALAALDVIRRWLHRSGSDSAARMKILRTVGTVLELTLQARCLQEARSAGVAESEVLAPGMFPSVSKAPEFRQREAHALARRLPLDTLRRLLARVETMQRLLYPRGTEPFIPDWESQLEVLVVEMAAAQASGG